MNQSKLIHKFWILIQIIIQIRTDSFPSMNQHQCYFHKTQQILKFCQNVECTLPLCKTCEEIHNQQHYKNGTKPDIISFLNAQSKAISELQTKVQLYQTNQATIQQAINKESETIIQSVKNIYKQKLQEIETQFKKIQEYKTRLTKIKKGSLKTLILFYSEPLPQISMRFYDEILQGHNFNRMQRIKEQLEKLITTITNQQNNLSYKPQTKKQTKGPVERSQTSFSSMSPIFRDNQYRIDKKDYEYKGDKNDKPKKSIFDSSTNKQIPNPQIMNLQKPKYDDHFIYHESNRPQTGIIQYSQDELIAKYSGKNKLFSENNYFGNQMKLENVIIDDSKKQRYQRLSANIDFDSKYRNNPYVSSGLNIKDLNSDYFYEGLNRKTEHKIVEKNNFSNHQNQYDYVPKFNVSNFNKPLQRQNNLLNFDNRFSKEYEDKGKSLSPFNKKQLQEQKKITISDLDNKYHFQKFKGYSENERPMANINLNAETNYNRQSLGAFDYEKLSQQVLSPEQIRKMLQKRIEERNKIMETKVVAKTYEQRSPYKGHQIQNIKYRRQHNAKDSFINQIYRNEKHD